MAKNRRDDVLDVTHQRFQQLNCKNQSTTSKSLAHLSEDERIPSFKPTPRRSPENAESRLNSVILMINEGGEKCNYGTEAAASSQVLAAHCGTMASGSTATPLHTATTEQYQHGSADAIGSEKTNVAPLTAQ